MTALISSKKTNVFLLLLLIIFLLIPTQTFAGKDRGLKSLRDKFQQKIALLIGNSNYSVSPLKNPANDAKDMATVLRKIGFDVTLITDASQRKMERAIRKFGQKLRNGDSGLFYYAGHGIQINGRNFLVPVDATIESESDVKYEAVDAGLLLGKMEDAGNDLNIVILDACRNNPFARSFRSANRGLARMDAPKGSLVAYATSPGSVAADGSGKNGVYTKHLIRIIKKPGLTIEQVLKQVRIAVVRETGNKQIPWESSSLMGNFYFTPGDSTQAFNQNVTVPTQQIDEEEELWFLVRKSSDSRDFKDFLAAYPGGRFSKHAKLKLKQLTTGSNLLQKKNELNKEISYSTSDYKVTDIRFFEAGPTAPGVSERVYINEFSRDKARYIYTEVNIKNFRYQEKFHSHKVKWIYYNPDGSVRGVLEGDFNVKSEWLNSWRAKGWGWDNPGNWSVGKYKVKVYIDGTFIADKTFHIKSSNNKYKNNNLAYSTSDYKITDIRFFEGGKTVPENKDRVYVNQFSKSKARYIYTEVKINNLRYQERFHNHTVKWIYYNSNGSIRAELSGDFGVKKTWETAWRYNGWGSSTPGSWPKGSYRVKVFIDDIEVGEESFKTY